VFFLGLLSSPLPYLLLAGIYFFGFALGMFSNKPDENSTKTVSSVTIPVEAKQKATDHTAYYFKIGSDRVQNQTDLVKSDDGAFSFSPDTGTHITQFRNVNVRGFHFPAVQFSRPPPPGC
jgi:hypothetical protein